MRKTNRWNRFHSITLLAYALLALLAVLPTMAAQSYPERPLRFIFRDNTKYPHKEHTVNHTVILDPAAPSGAGLQRPWKALDSLQGKVVAFIDNSKPNFNHLADDLAELLVSRYGVSRVVRHRKRAASVPALEAVYAEIEADCDLVITGSGD